MVLVQAEDGTQEFVPWQACIPESIQEQQQQQQQQQGVEAGGAAHAVNSTLANGTVEDGTGNGGSYEDEAGEGMRERHHERIGVGSLRADGGGVRRVDSACEGFGVSGGHASWNGRQMLRESRCGEPTLPLSRPATCTGKQTEDAKTKQQHECCGALGGVGEGGREGREGEGALGVGEEANLKHGWLVAGRRVRLLRPPLKNTERAIQKLVRIRRLITTTTAITLTLILPHCYYH